MQNQKKNAVQHLIPVGKRNLKNEDGEVDDIKQRSHWNVSDFVENERQHIGSPGGSSRAEHQRNSGSEEETAEDSADQQIISQSGNAWDFQKQIQKRRIQKRRNHRFCRERFSKTDRSEQEKQKIDGEDRDGKRQERKKVRQRQPDTGRAAHDDTRRRHESGDSKREQPVAENERAKLHQITWGQMFLHSKNLLKILRGSVEDMCMTETY